MCSGKASQKRRWQSRVLKTEEVPESILDEAGHFNHVEDRDQGRKEWAWELCPSLDIQSQRTARPALGTPGNQYCGAPDPETAATQHGLEEELLSHGAERAHALSAQRVRRTAGPQEVHKSSSGSSHKVAEAWCLGVLNCPTSQDTAECRGDKR